MVSRWIGGHLEWFFTKWFVASFFFLSFELFIHSYSFFILFYSCVEPIHFTRKTVINSSTILSIANFGIRHGSGKPHSIILLRRNESLTFFFLLFLLPSSFLFSDDAVDLLESLLERNPTHRLGSGADDGLEIMKHPFFKSINFKSVFVFLLLFSAYSLVLLLLLNAFINSKSSPFFFIARGKEPSSSLQAQCFQCGGYLEY